MSKRFVFWDYFSSIIKKEHYRPGILGCFINPFFILRRGIYHGIRKNSLQLSGKLLDFGCGSKPYKSLFQVDEYIGLDIKESGHPKGDKKADIFYDGEKIPFPDSYFDSVFSSEVFEHVFNLSEILKEINRVLQIQGNLLITIPFAWFEHETPYDFARYTSYGIRHLLEDNGFEIVKEEKTTGYFLAIIQMIIVYLRINIFTSNSKILKSIYYLLIFAPINIFGLIFSKILPEDYGYYLSNVILSKKVRNINWP